MIEYRHTPSEATEKTIDILNERGWCKGRTQDDIGQVCMLGAIDKATATYELEVAVGKAVASKLNPERDFTHKNVSAMGTIAGWNDADERTIEEVQDVLMSVAKDFRNEGR